jgi:hypothetical protein
VAQSSVAWGQRGVATATNMFSRSVGSAVGVAVFGAMVNAVVGSEPTAPLLATGVHRVFVGILAIAVAMGVLELFMPVRVPTRDRPHKHTNQPPGHGPAQDLTR